MPAGDRTGPRGMGPMTGRGAGFCAGYETAGYGNPMPGYGRGMGWGPGRAWAGPARGGRAFRYPGGRRGWRHWYQATGLPGWARFGYAPGWGPSPAAAFAPYAEPPAPEQEVAFLRAEAEWLQEQLEAITQRIEELEQEA